MRFLKAGILFGALSSIFNTTSVVAGSMLEATSEGETLVIRVADRAAVARASEAIWNHQVQVEFKKFSDEDAVRWKRIRVEFQACDAADARICTTQWLAMGSEHFAAFQNALKRSASVAIESLGPDDPILEQLLRGAWNGAKNAITTYDVSWWALGGFAVGFIAGGPGTTALYVAKIVKFLSQASIAYMALEITEAIANGKYERAGELFGEALILYAVTSGGYKAGNKARGMIERERERIVMAQTALAAKTVTPPPKPSPPASRPAAKGGRGASNTGGGSRPSASGTTSATTGSRPTPRQRQEAWDRLEEDTWDGGTTAVAEAPPRTRPSDPRTTSRPTGSRTRPTTAGSTRRSPSAPIASDPVPGAPQILAATRPLPMPQLAPLPIRSLSFPVVPATQAEYPAPIEAMPSGYERLEITSEQRDHELAAYRLYRLLATRANMQGEDLGFSVPEVRRTRGGELLRANPPMEKIEASAIPSNLIIFDWLIANPNRPIARNVGVSSAVTGRRTLSKEHADAFQTWDSETWLASTGTTKVSGHTPYAQPIRWTNARSSVPNLAIHRVLSDLSFDDILAALVEGDRSLLTPQEMYKLYQRYLTLVWIQQIGSPGDARIFSTAVDEDSEDPLEEYLRHRQAPATTFEVARRLAAGETIVLGADLSVDVALYWLREKCRTKRSSDAFPPDQVCERIAAMFDERPDHRIDPTDLWTEIFSRMKKKNSDGFYFNGTYFHYRLGAKAVYLKEEIPYEYECNAESFLVEATYSDVDESLEFVLFLRDRGSRGRTARSLYFYSNDLHRRLIPFMEQRIGKKINRLEVHLSEAIGEFGMNDNLNEFNRNLRNGMSRIDAVRQTHVGRMYTEMGYSEVVDITPPQPIEIPQDGLVPWMLHPEIFESRSIQSERFIFQKPQ